ncbi:MAG: helix-turn-helix domain-containing protein, partial [Armatimonadota bacterium]|nr:TetR/AcrR family transcriptional regulator [Armatimonadota bacterium]MDW8144132.1 helix-turn-helix domain-containing protein [Armatimonadota bacterium]
MKSRRRMTPEERQIQIIEAAAKLFAERGFDGTSIDDIAEACGVAPGLIYHYFDSKAEILKALIERKAFLPRMAEILRTPPKATVEETLTELACAIWEMLEERRELTLMVHGEMQRNPEVARVIGKVIKTGIQMLSEYLSAQKSEGRLRGDLDTEIFVRTFWGAIFESFFAHHKLSPFVRRISPRR